MRFAPARKALKGAIACCLLLCLVEFVFPVGLSKIFIEKKDISQVLKEIYQEMKEFDKYPGCDFVKREFFVGEDDDDTNKDIHVVILVQDVAEKEKVTDSSHLHGAQKRNTCCWDCQIHKSPRVLCI
jgi:hypothetical protein